MENVNEEQYQTILRYMQEHPELDFMEASSVLAKFDYNLDKADQQLNQLNNQHPLQSIPTNGQQEYENFDDEQSDKMRKFLRKRVEDNNKTKYTIKRSRQCLSKMCLRITEKILPQLIKRKIIRSLFYQLYQDSSVIQLNNRTIKNAIVKVKQHKKYLLVIISGNQKNHEIAEFLRKKKLLHYIQQRFQIVGVVYSELSQYPQFIRQSANSIIALRLNQMEELQIMEKFSHHQIQNIDTAIIKELITNISKQAKDDFEKMRRIKDQSLSVNSYQNNSTIYIPEEDDSEEDEGQAYLRKKRESTLIRKQNEEYKKMEIEREQNRKLEEIRLNQIQKFRQEREARRMSIPEQPEENCEEQVIKIQFRCPNGEIMSRRFLKSEDNRLLFHWVDLNEDIEFEDDECGKDGLRKFDLLYSYPLESLRQHIDATLSDVFEDNFAKIVIKEQ